jgi:copper chaperone CopZ
MMAGTRPTIELILQADEAAAAVTGALDGRGYRVVRSFDLSEAAAAHPGCICPHHGTELCTCRYVTLAAYPGESNVGSTLVLAMHSHDRRTIVSLLQGEEHDWLRVVLPLAVSNQQMNREDNMTTKTFTVPNISCGHCTHAIKMELGEVPGVQSVEADVATKNVTVEWKEPASWDMIKSVLVEINYPPAE